MKLPYTIWNHGAQFLNNNLYIFGGKGKKEWEKMDDMNKKRRWISNSSVVLKDKIWVCGGGDGHFGPLKSVEMYDSETNKRKYTKQMNKSRSSAAAAVVNGKIFCFGYYDSIECYDLSSDVWTEICNMPQRISGHDGVEIDGHFIVIEGIDNEYLKNVWALNTMDENTEWMEKPSMSIPRAWFSTTKVDGKIFVCGENSNGKAIDLVEILDGEVWRNDPKMPIPRVAAAAVIIPMEFARELEQFTVAPMQQESSRCSVQ